MDGSSKSACSSMAESALFALGFSSMACGVETGSSAMILRIEARISSMLGWPFFSVVSMTPTPYTNALRAQNRHVPRVAPFPGGVRPGKCNGSDRPHSPRSADAV
jgi:hypothetical protein